MEPSRQRSLGGWRDYGRGKWGLPAIAPTPGLGALAALAMIFATIAALWWAPTEKTMGDVQRLFYFHMPSA